MPCAAWDKVAGLALAGLEAGEAVQEPVNAAEAYQEPVDAAEAGLEVA